MLFYLFPIFKLNMDLKFPQKRLYKTETNTDESLTNIRKNHIYIYICLYQLNGERKKNHLV